MEPEPPGPVNPSQRGARQHSTDYGMMAPIRRPLPERFFMRKSMALFMGVLVLYCAGCRDDAVSPASFSLEVEVVDADGAPVPGLLMSVVADLPYYQDGWVADKAAVHIPFVLPVGCRGQLLVEDAEGIIVRHLVDEIMPAGKHSVMWNGRDDEDDMLLSAAYWAHLKIRDVATDSLLFQDRAGMYLADFDPIHGHAGVTDARGRIRLTDRRIFPSLMGVENMPATSEEGLVIGDIVFDGSMRFTFADTAGGYTSMRFRCMVTGTGTLRFVFDSRAADDGPKVVPAEPKKDQPDPEVFSLGPVYPNPFN